MSATKNYYSHEINYIHPQLMSYAEAINKDFIEYQYNNRKIEYYHQDLLFCVKQANWNKRVICKMKEQEEFGNFARIKAEMIFNKILLRINTIDVKLKKINPDYDSMRLNKIIKLVLNLKKNIL